MTIPNEVDRITYIGSGITGPYTFPFKIFSTDQLRVFTKLLTSPYTETDLVLTTDYSVTIDGPNEGTVTLVSTLSSSYRLIIVRDVEYTQESAFRTQGQQNASSWENAIDYGRMVDQKLRHGVEGAVRIPSSEDPDDFSMELPVAELRASKALWFDASGNATVSTSSASEIPDTSLTQVVNTIAALKALAVPSSAVTYLVRGYTSAGDLGGGLFRWNSSDTSTDNEGTIIAADAGGTGRWNRLYEGPVHVRWFGTVGNGIADDTDAIKDAYAASTNLVFGDDNYNITDDLVMPTGSRWRFDGTTITYDTTDGIAIDCSSISDFQIDGNLIITGTANSAGTAAGIYVANCNRFRIENVTCKLIKGWGFKLDPGASSGGRADKGQFSNIIARDCYYGWESTVGTGAEYHSISNFQATECTYGMIVSAGNLSVVGGNITDNDNGLYLGPGSNHGHGVFTGVKITHNTNYNIKADTVTNGFDFCGCTIYGDGVGTGIIWFLNSKGINITGGILDAAIACDGTTGQNVIADNFIAGTYAQTQGGTNPGKVWYHGNFDGTGQWYLNSPAWCYVEATRATSTLSFTNATTGVCIFNNEIKDNQGAYNTTSGVFTTPVAGRYRLTANLTATAASGLVDSFGEVLVGGVTKAYFPIVALSATLGIGGGSVDLQLAANAAVNVNATITATTPVLAITTSVLQIQSLDGGA